MTPSGVEVPGTSRRLREPKFQSLIQQYLVSDEVILDAADGNLEIYGNGGLRPHYDLAIVLTNQRLLGVRGRGILGIKALQAIDLKWIHQVGVTREWNVNVKYKDDTGWPGWWKLHIGSEQHIADHWMRRIQQAMMSSRGELPQPNSAAAEPSSEWQAMREQLAEFAKALAPTTGQDSIGRPFGESLGLEAAMQVMFESFESVDDMRSAGETMAVTILTDNLVGTEDLDYVMGLPIVLGLTPVQAHAVDLLAGAAKTFLAQFNKPGADMWELWKQRDNVAGEFLCWHAVAWQRLATLGKVQAL